MSRHDFPGTNGATSVAIGWDRPLDTFFVQVLGPHPELDGEETTFLWEGTAPGELRTAAEAIRIASAHAILPADLGATLETDRLKTVATRDGAAQIAVKPFLSDPKRR